MKKIFFVLIVLSFLTASIGFALASQGQEKIYLVKKGDSIHKIATQVFGLTWSEVKPAARERHLIHPGDRITLNDLIDEAAPCPVLSKKQLAQDEKRLKYLGLNEKEIGKILSAHFRAIAGKKQNGFRWGILQSGDIFDKILIRDFTVRQNTAFIWPDRQKLKATRVYNLSNRRELWCSLDGNWAIRKLPKRPLTEIIFLPLKGKKERVKTEILQLPL